MYNKFRIKKLISLINMYDGINDKTKLSNKVKQEFNLIVERKVYKCSDFSIRFSKSDSKRMSNTVLALSRLQKYDNTPFFVCIVTPTKNYLLLANTTFLKKISHSSKDLRVDNIKGSFNGSDIYEIYNEIENDPDHFEELYKYHEKTTFNENLIRLVEATNNIVGTRHKYHIDNQNIGTIYNSIHRTKQFIESKEFTNLQNILTKQVNAVKDEIILAGQIDNVNLKGRIIEYLITNNGTKLFDKIVLALQNNTALPEFTTPDELWDYYQKFSDFDVAVDIKAKIMFLGSNPKGANIDKLLKYLDNNRTVYLIFIVGVSDPKTNKVISKLCSIFDERLIEGAHFQHHWAGRDTRGVVQFSGESLNKILFSSQTTNVSDAAKKFLTSLINR